MDRFGASATKASAAQSRVKQIERMQREGLLEPPVQVQSFRPHLQLPDPPSSSNEILVELKDANIGYDSEVLIRNVNCESLCAMFFCVYELEDILTLCPTQWRFVAA